MNFASCASLCGIIALLLFVPSDARAGDLAPERLPLARETRIARDKAPAAVILIPDDPEYHRLGKWLAQALFEKTGARLDVESARQHVLEEPTRVRPESLNRNFILLGQFWNNPVLERLYARGYAATDAVYPGAGGFELRTVARPFHRDHNCIVATGSDVDGCRQALVRLVERVQRDAAGGFFPYLLEVRLTGRAKEEEEKFGRDPRLSEIDRYTRFGHPEGKTWRDWGTAPNYSHWTKEAGRAASYFGMRYWLTGDERHAQIFKDFLKSAIEHDRGEGNGFMPGLEYGLGDLPTVWDAIDESPVFSAAERRGIDHYLNNMMSIHRDEYFAPKVLGTPLEQIPFSGRHQFVGAFWFGAQGEWLLRNFRLNPQEAEFAVFHRDNAEHLLKRHLQTPFYSGDASLISDEGWLVLRYALRTGHYELLRRGYLAALADFFVAMNSNTGKFAGYGQSAPSLERPQWQESAKGRETLNVAGWLLPDEGYLWYRGRLQPDGESFFNYHPLAFCWETPLADRGAARLEKKFAGVFVVPVGEGWHSFIQSRPSRVPGLRNGARHRYVYDPVPYDRSFKWLVLRSGFERDDQYLVISGQQGLTFSLDDLNAVSRYDDLGQSLLRAPDGRNSERLAMNSLLASNGRPDARQSIQGEISAADLGPESLIACHARRHDGVDWVRRIFWLKKGWFLVADEVDAHESGPHYLAQTWLGREKFQAGGSKASQATNGVTLDLIGTEERPFFSIEGNGVRQQETVDLVAGKPAMFFTLLAASAKARPGQWNLRRIGPAAVLVAGAAGSSDTYLAFRGKIDLPSLKIDADMGLISRHRIAALGLRSIAVGNTVVLPNGSSVTANQSVCLGWDLERNELNEGKAGFGLSISELSPEEARRLKGVRDSVRVAVERALVSVESQSSDVPDAKGAVVRDPLSRPVADAGPALEVKRKFRLRPPVSLAGQDIDGDGSEELLLYRGDDSPRFAPHPSLGAPPVAVDFDGNGRPDIAVATRDRRVTVFRPDGSVRWKVVSPSPVYAMTAGDFDGDGRAELALSQHSWASVYDHAGHAVFSQAVYHYTGTGVAFGDVDGDGKTELVATTGSGVNVGRPGNRVTRIGIQQMFGNGRCRIWLRDLDRDGKNECYIGGDGTDPGAYDLSGQLNLKWTFGGAVLRPRDVAVLDLDGDGSSEMVSACEDGFLYVVDLRSGKFKFSRTIGGNAWSLATVSRDENGGRDILIAGMESGEVVAFGANLRVLGRARISEKPLAQVGILKRRERPSLIVASDQEGTAAEIEIPTR